MRNEKIPFGKYNLDHARMLVTKKAKGLTLSDWIERKKLPTNPNALVTFFEDVLLQIAYTLIVFEESGFVHHDLHAGNIFVEELTTPLHLSFNIGGSTSIIRNVKYFVQIYDFDSSSKTSTMYSPSSIRNTYLDSISCRKLGQCNEFFPNLDWFTILHHLYVLNKNIPIPFERLVRKDMLNYKYGPYDLVYMGRPCFCVNPKKKCDQCTPITLNDYIIISPKNYLIGTFSSNFCDCEAAYSCPSAKF
jgi:hypothetical protein